MCHRRHVYYCCRVCWLRHHCRRHILYDRRWRARLELGQSHTESDGFKSELCRHVGRCDWHILLLYGHCGAGCHQSTRTECKFAFFFESIDSILLLLGMSFYVLVCFFIFCCCHKIIVAAIGMAQCVLDYVCCKRRENSDF